MATKNCAKCGTPMIEKEGKFGRFLSCVNWPRCDYSEDIEQRIAALSEVEQN